jgi:hypothetical protein
MSKLAQVATATTVVEHQVKLSPALRRKLLTELRTYAELKSQADVIALAIKKGKDKVESVLGEIGESNLSVEGFKTTLVCAKGSSKLDPMKLVALGVSTDLIKKATVEGAPKAPYIKITVPGGRDDNDA